MSATISPAGFLRPDSYRSDAGLAGKHVVVFLHGYYGSALREKNEGPRRFIRVSTVLAGKFAIALESDRLGLKPSPDLEVEGLMAKVPVLPYLYDIDVYGKFLRRLAKEHHVVAFAYDWRKDLSQAAAQLGALVEELKAKGAKISLLAHSMGGLVAAYYLAYGAQNPDRAQLDWSGAIRLARVGFLGVPFGGTFAIFRNMQHGTGYPWNPTLLEAGTVSSWPASYHLLPLANSRLLDPTGNALSLPLESPDFWKIHRLGLFRGEAPEPIAAARQIYTKNQLEAAARFQSLLRLKQPPPQGPRLFHVRGMGRPTLAKGYFSQKEILCSAKQVKERGLSFAPLEEDGDGSVPFSASVPPAAFMGKEKLTHFAHDRLFDDPAVEKECLAFLSEEN